MRNPTFTIQTPKCFSFGIPYTSSDHECTRECRVHSVFRNPEGFIYIALLAALVIIGISLGAAGKYWQNVVLRDKEEDLLFRGDQYRQAIERYYTAIPTIRLFPPASMTCSKTPVPRQGNVICDGNTKIHSRVRILSRSGIRSAASSGYAADATGHP